MQKGGSHIKLVKHICRYNPCSEHQGGIYGSSNTCNSFVAKCFYSSWKPGAQYQLKEKIINRWNSFYSNYEEFVGLKDVQNAQLEVKNAEQEFLEARGEERVVMRNAVEIRDQLRHVRERLSHVNYSSPLYPQLANEQHELVTEEEKVKSQVEAAAEKERDTFLVLSAAMRDSYEKERTRVERTKNWSLIGSVVGTLIGMLGSSYINRIRTHDLKKAIEDKSQFEDVKENISVMLPSMQEQYGDIKEEIKQLQVCLINKLLDPPAKTDSSNQTTDNSASTLKTVNKVLQSFQSQLVNLQQNSSESKEIVAAQVNKLVEISQSLNSSNEEVQSEIKNIKNGIQQIKATLLNSSIPSTGQNNTMEYFNSEILEAEASTQGIVYPWLIWGGVMTAVYFILTV